MEQVNQLRTMRDEALTRLQTNPDYRLLTSLDQLIVDLETVMQGPKFGLSVVNATEKNAPPLKTSVDDVIAQMGEELVTATKEKK